MGNSSNDLIRFLGECMDKSEENKDETEKRGGAERPELPSFFEEIDAARRIGEHRIFNDEGEDDDEIEEFMDSGSYHNKAVNCYRNGKRGQAIDICVEGVEHFPNNVDLMADCIEYCSKSGKMDKASYYFSMLSNTVTYDRWNWRAYSFSLNYLIADDPINNEKICREIIYNYKKYIPNSEGAYMSEFELEEALGNVDRSIEVLKTAIESFPNACQCALKLADLQFESGQYESAAKTIEYGLSASVETQSSINVPYLVMLKIMVKDAILRKNALKGIDPDRTEIDKLSAEYDLISSEFPELLRYSHAININKVILKLMKNEPDQVILEKK